MTDTIQAASGLSEHSHGVFVPVQTRSERLKSTNVEDFPAISIREEQWKYLAPERLKGLDKTALAEFTGDIESELAPGVATSWIDSTHRLFGSAGTPEDRVSAAGWSSSKAAFLVSIPSDVVNGEVSTVALNSFDDTASALHLVVEAKSNSRSVLIIDHKGSTTLSENVEIIVEEGAQLTLVSLQDWSDTSVHQGSHFAKIGKDANLKHIVVTLGGAVVRVTPSAQFAAPGGEANLFGLYFADSEQYLEHRIFVDHAQPNCKSRVTYKGALQGKNAHTVWVGDVLIRSNATGTDTYELNRNLLLTDGARADSVPNLEIETGQIQGAGHASASGRFDDEQLFYLQARGITELEARRLVVRGFLMEVVQQIGVPELEERLAKALEEELERSSN